MKLITALLLQSCLLLCIVPTVYAAIPAAPSGLTASAATHFSGSRMVDLTWTDNASDETGFRLERCAGASCSSFAQIATLGFNKLSFNDLDVASGTQYSYRIRAWNADGSSSFTSTASVTTGSAPTPVASLTLSSSTAIVNEVVQFDGRASTGYKQQLNVSGFVGVPGVLIDYGDGDTAYLLNSAHKYKAAGTFNVTLTVRNSAGTANSTTGITVTVTNPSYSTVVDMTSSGDAYYIAPGEYGVAFGPGNATKLQNAINYAAANMTTVHRKVIVPAGAEIHTTGITFADRSDSNWIKIVTSGTLPHAKKRILDADIPQLPEFRVLSSGGTSSAVFTAGTAPGGATGKHHYYIEGVYATKNSAFNMTSMVYFAGNGTGWTLPNKIPHHFIFDHVYFDGAATHPTTAYSRLGMRIDADFLSVVNSRFKGFGDFGDALCFQGGTYTGNQSFENNELEAAGELFIIGGGASQEIAYTATPNPTTRTSATLTPAPTALTMQPGDRISFLIAGSRTDRNTGTTIRTINYGTGAVTFDDLDVAPDTTASSANYGPNPSGIEFRRNHGYKNTAQRSPTDAGYKNANLFELKAGKDIVVDGNVLHDQWFRDQPTGPPFMVTVQNQFGENHFITIENLQITNNKTYNTISFINFVSVSDNGRDAQGNPRAAQEARNFYIANNLAFDMGYIWDTLGAQNDININGTLRGVIFNHNTLLFPIANGLLAEFSNLTDNRIREHQLVNNIIAYNTYGWKSAALNPATGTNYNNNNADAVIAGQLSNSLISTNIITGAEGVTAAGNGNQPSVLNRYLTNPPIDVNYVANAGGYADNLALDGTDIGVNMTTLNASILNTVTGDWSAAGGCTVYNWHIPCT